jgi:hypothetical protein
MPAQPVAQDRPLGHQVPAVIRQQLDLAPGPVQLRCGQAGLAQGRVRDGQRVDRVRLTRLGSARRAAAISWVGIRTHRAPGRQQFTGAVQNDLCAAFDSKTTSTP